MDITKAVTVIAIMIATMVIIAAGEIASSNKADVEKSVPESMSDGVYYCDLSSFSDAATRCTKRLQEACPDCKLKLLSIDERRTPNIATFQIVYPEEK